MKKFSLSMLFTLVLVGLFTTVAFAAVPTAPESVTVAIDENAHPNTVQGNWSDVTATPAVTSYDVTLKNVSDNTTTSITLGSLTDLTVDLTSKLTNGKTYQLQVVATNGDGSSAATKSKLFTYGEPYAPNNAVIRHTDAVDSGVHNANGTGVGELNKAKNNQDVHGNYQNNTNSCASCHQTHTAATSRLLFKSSDYDVCIACHNGTMGAGMYNVFETDVTKDLGGGTFGGTVMGNMSVHLADGTVEIEAAPGSNSKVVGASWTSEFSCSSCHDPHGSYSTRLLKSNPNDMADVALTTDSTKGVYYGQKLGTGLTGKVDILDATSVSDATTKTAAYLKSERLKAIPTTTRTAALGNLYAAVRIQMTSTDVNIGDYKGIGLKQNDYVIQLYKYYENRATKGFDRAVYEQAGGNSGDGIDLVAGSADFNNDATHTTDWNTTKPGAWKNKISNGKAAANTGYYVNGGLGFVKVADATAATAITALTNVKTLQVVTWPLTDAGLAFANGKKVQKTRFQDLVGTNYATGYNEFCAACHVDYLTANKYVDENNGTGIDGNYFHHAMSSSYTCARCHYAHGTDVTWMHDAAGRTITEVMAPLANGGEGYDITTATDYMMDKNPSSALKRYTNMAVCYGCHTSSHAEVIVNDGNYAQSYDQVNGFLSDGYAKWFNEGVNGTQGSVTTKGTAWGTARQ